MSDPSKENLKDSVVKLDEIDHENDSDHHHMGFTMDQYHINAVQVETADPDSKFGL